MTGNDGCLSQSCSEPFGSATEGVCSEVPETGMPNGAGCSVAANCESRSCDSETYLCVDRFALAPSQAARMKTKRDGTTSHNPKDKRGKLSSWFRSNTYCAAGQTACATVGGFEVRGTSSRPLGRKLTDDLTIPMALQCIDTQSALESCGGCPQNYDEDSSDQATGIDCTSLPFVDEVYCNFGKCKIGR